MKGRIRLDSISVILVRPKFPENIGAVARAMKNMGLRRLVIVNGCSPLHPDAYKLSSGSEDILERAEEYFTLKEAVLDMGCVVGTTSRKGKDRSPFLTPEGLAKILIPVSLKNTIGIAFGSEKEGLTNEELSLCHLYVRIPSEEEFPSLNLAQAVMIICYELFQASETFRLPSSPLARSEQLERMYEDMGKTLLRIGFLDPHHPKRIMRALRKLFGRSQMEEREVRILHGIWSQMDRYARKNRSDRP